MSRIGVCGLGKLGFPIALVVNRKGHSVIGYDPSPVPRQILDTRIYPHRELKAQQYLEGTTMRLAGSMSELVAESDIVLVLVQTPHDPRYEGVSRLPAERVDFDYTYLKSAVANIAAQCAFQHKRVVLTVMSTVLPGTMDREIKPLLNAFTPLVYSPAFPAMGTAILDFEEPEFYLLGVDDAKAAESMEAFYKTLSGAQIARMSVRSAEATKVFYNSFVSAKIGLASAWMEMCDGLGANVDDVSRALTAANSRLISPRYMRGGMPDGGGCHPRDNIALSWLARSLGMKYDLFGSIMEAREQQTAWLAGKLEQYARARDLPVVILGKAFKANTELTVGSPATLLREILIETYPAEQVSWWDPYLDEHRTFAEPAVFFIATCHDDFYGLTYPAGSVIIDPWGRMTDRDGIQVVRVGRDAPREVA
jgi:UDPglucose 6-dehydrogenase